MRNHGFGPEYEEHKALAKKALRNSKAARKIMEKSEFFSKAWRNAMHREDKWFEVYMKETKAAQNIAHKIMNEEYGMNLPIY